MVKDFKIIKYWFTEGELEFSWVVNDFYVMTGWQS